jgi:uncharacterized Zn-finger protein
MEIITFKILSIESRPSTLKAKCKCDNSSTVSDWIIKSDKATCSYCGRSHNGRFFDVCKAKCKCDSSGTVSDWLVADNKVVCAYCGRSYSGHFIAIRRKAAKCKCDSAKTISDWFEKDNETWVCSYCGRTR